MSKDLNMLALFDLYESLLTEKQQETLEMYYNSDLSLGEISEETGITRQGVMNCIKKSESRLTELEEKLGLLKRLSEVQNDITALENILGGITLAEAERAEINRRLTDIKSKL